MRIGLDLDSDSDSGILSLDGKQSNKSLTSRATAGGAAAATASTTSSIYPPLSSIKGKAKQTDQDRSRLQAQVQAQKQALEAVQPEADSTRKNPSKSKPLIPPWIVKQQQRQRRSGNKITRFSSSSSYHDNRDVDTDTDSDADTQTESDSLDSESESSNWNRRKIHSDPFPDSDSSDEYQQDSDSEIDSEEEQWPVHPNKIGKGNRQRNNREKKDEEVVRRLIKMHSSSRSELSGRFSRTYEKASQNYAARLRGLSLGPDSPQPGQSKSNVAGREREASEARAWLAVKELEEVNGILEGLQIKAREDERKEEAAFEERQRLLWKSVEDSIRLAEKERDDELAAQAAQLAAARKAQEEREKKAKEAREAEERRIEEEKRAKEEAERRKIEEEEREAARARQEQVGGGIALKNEARMEWQKWTDVMKNIKEKILPYVSSTSDLRKQCFAAKRQITPKVGQLTNSRQEVVRITVSISEVLTAARNVPTPSGESEVYVWILNHLSKCLIRQAEQEVAVKQDTAFPLARVVRWLMDGGHEQLAEVLMARLVKKCPWVLAFCPERKASDDDEKYAKMLGKSESSEPSVQYSNRMSGILAFYFAILQSERTAPPNPLSSPNPDVSKVLINFRPSFLWTWQSRAVTPPFTNHGLVPTLWCCYLEIAGPRSLNIYGKQSEKVWKLLLTKGIRESKAEFCHDETARPAVARLRIILEAWEKDGEIKNATGGREMDP